MQALHRLSFAYFTRQVFASQSSPCLATTPLEVGRSSRFQDVCGARDRTKDVQEYPRLSRLMDPEARYVRPTTLCVIVVAPQRSMLT